MCSNYTFITDVGSLTRRCRHSSCQPSGRSQPMCIGNDRLGERNCRLNSNQLKCVQPTKVPMTNCSDFFLCALAAPATSKHDTARCSRGIWVRNIEAVWKITTVSRLTSLPPFPPCSLSQYDEDSASTFTSIEIRTRQRRTKRKTHRYHQTSISSERMSTFCDF